MRHSQHISGFPFCKEPMEFNRNSERGFLQYCLGATLYMPGTKTIVDKLLEKRLPELTSMVMCFEDAIQESDVHQAEENVLHHLKTLSDGISQKRITIDEIPLTFLRVRNTEQFKIFASKLNSDQASVLTGFVFPKFYSHNAKDYLDTLNETCERLQTRLYGMPILEGHTIAYCETRKDELVQLKKIIDPVKESVLNIRVGGTDFSALFGVRRDINASIYDILVVRDCLADILNVFNRDPEYTVSAPVWEYFLAYKKDDISTLLRQSLHRSLLNRNPILNEAIDGLLREVIQDKANGFVGKTVIHPSHIRFANAMQAVTKEEYDDALQILDSGGGVVKSITANKMNEIAPHQTWAQKIKLRSDAYGVVEDESAYLRLFGRIEI
jgi:citrate lyase beta subunit